jgi:hypothetical protein
VRAPSRPAATELKLSFGSKETLPILGRDFKRPVFLALRNTALRVAAPRKPYTPPAEAKRVQSRQNASSAATNLHFFGGLAALTVPF